MGLLKNLNLDIYISSCINYCCRYRQIILDGKLDIKFHDQLSITTDLFVMFMWKISAMIANECSHGETLPVLYVSRDEVCFY